MDQYPKHLSDLHVNLLPVGCWESEICQAVLRITGNCHPPCRSNEFDNPEIFPKLDGSAYCAGLASSVVENMHADLNSQNPNRCRSWGHGNDEVAAWKSNCFDVELTQRDMRTGSDSFSVGIKMAGYFQATCEL